MSAVLAGARREVLGFFRRRESFWLLAGLGAGCALPLAVAAFGPGIAGRGVAEAFAVTEAGFTAEVVHNYACVLEVVVLVLLAYALASRSLGEEIERGSWLLLRLTPAGVERTLGGKALGIAFVLATAHGFASSLLLLMTPFLRRTHVEVALSTLGPLVVAMAAIPEGFAHPSLGTRMPGGPVAFRLLTMGRAALLLFALAVVFSPDPSPRSPAFVDYWLKRPALGPDAAWSLGQALVPWALALTWLALTGAILWKLVVRRWRSVDR